MKCKYKECNINSTEGCLSFEDANHCDKFIRYENTEMKALIKEFSDACKNECPAYDPQTCDGCAMNQLRIYGESLK